MRDGRREDAATRHGFDSAIIRPLAYPCRSTAARFAPLLPGRGHNLLQPGGRCHAPR